MKTLVVGIGNPTRSDDGAGCAVAERIAALAVPEVEVRIMQQLQVELADDFAHFDRVIVVDAATGGGAVQTRVVRAALPQGPLNGRGRESAYSWFGEPEGSTSHHLSPAALLAVTGKLHGRAPDLLLCTVRGERFEFGASLSPAVELRVDEATRRIAGLLRGLDLEETC